MPSTYSTRLRAELQATGENAGTWGSKANTVIQRLEESIAGVLSKNVGVSCSAPVSLTANDGSSDESRYHAVIVSGVLLSAVPLAVPAVEKTYWINNKTTGAQLSFKPAGGTSFALPSGWSKIITDGTSVENATSVAAAASAITQANADARYAQLSARNSLVGQQVFTSGIQALTTINVSGEAMFKSSVVVKSSTVGASTVGPRLGIFKDVTGVSGAMGGALTYKHNNASGTEKDVAEIYVSVSDPTNASENAALVMRTMVNGSLTNIAAFDRGFFMAGVSGTDKGAGTINGTMLFVQGASVATQVYVTSVLSSLSVAPAAGVSAGDMILLTATGSVQTSVVLSAVYEILCQAGGGAGGTPSDGGGGGGGAGGCLQAWWVATTAVVSGNVGAAAGVSHLNGLCSATAGGTGENGATGLGGAGGAGGTAAPAAAITKSLAITGGDGQTAGSAGTGGGGGASLFGSGGRGGKINGAGQPGRAYGSGGGGGGTGGAANGAQGVIVLKRVS